jgi:hypothetical protein
VRRLAYLFFFGLAGCPSPTSVTTDQVLTLTVCEGGTPCTVVADGNSPIDVLVCVPGTDPRASGLTATLTLSRGRWATPSDPTNPLVYTAALLGVACVDAQAIAPSDLAPLFVTANVAGYTTSACIQMSPPPIAFVQVSSAPPVVAEGATFSTAITAIPIASGGATLPTSTTVMFTATIQPTGSSYTFDPTETTVGEGGAATMLVVAPSATSAVVTASAQVPSPPACPNQTAPAAGPAVSGTVTIPVFAPPAAPEAGADAGADATTGSTDAAGE